MTWGDMYSGKRFAVECINNPDAKYNVAMMSRVDETYIFILTSTHKSGFLYDGYFVMPKNRAGIEFVLYNQKLNRVELYNKNRDYFVTRFKKHGADVFSKIPRITSRTMYGVINKTPKCAPPDAIKAWSLTEKVELSLYLWETELGAFVMAKPLKKTKKIRVRNASIARLYK